ncbi:phosphoribosylaminoimidazolesuccinocarboxamide synthase [candidate division KSB1 bacterium]|nr:phosphoribosylaminoimidazolesuccinocarboxamide synthase [candidate division KSB1 bacterium]
MNTLLQTHFPTLKLLGRGKVRDIYDLGEHLLIVTTDRLSAFDVIMPQGIPHKGRVLTQLSAFWFQRTADIIENHLISVRVEDYPEVCRPYREQLVGRSMLVVKTQPLPVECVVRGYLSGSGWLEYKETGSVCGIKLSSGLKESDKLASPIFTPATKAEAGEHDENISFERAAQIVGKERAEQLRDFSIRIYQRGREMAEQRGIIIADTKMEFGVREGKLILIDELLTPDSSRFWPRASYKPGGSQPSFDKQFVRDYLLSIKWNKQPPAPNLPEEVVRVTSEKYLEAFAKLAS